MNDKTMVINYIDIEKDFVLVGATNKQRWEEDREAGLSGVDAKTIVFVTLEGNHKSNIAVDENARFHVYLHEPLRKLATNCVHSLFEIAWEIKNKEMNLKTAKENYFGFEIKINMVL
jgi:hypothetical protein